MTEETRTRIAVLSAPYGREAWFDDVRFETGMQVLRVTIKEGRRFTQLDLDPETAERWPRGVLCVCPRTARGQCRVMAAAPR